MLYKLLNLSLVFLTFISNIYAQSPNCNLVTTAPYQTLKAGLSPLWAQEYIGTDLAKEFLATQNQLYLTKIGNFDGGFVRRDLLGAVHPNATSFYQHPATNAAYLNHGTQSSNNINSPLFGTSGYGQLTHLYSIQDYLIAKITAKFLEQPADLLNLEIHTLCVLSYTSWCKLNADKFGGLAAIKENLAKLSTKTTVVAAAGNNAKTYPKQVTWPMITVGSMAPNGNISDFSNQSIDISVLAPSDNFLYSYGTGGSAKFGGTSGAAPLVTGSLANVISILGPTSIQNLQKFLQLTSIKLNINHNNPNLNGYGMINTYKLTRLAALKNLTQENLQKLSSEAEDLFVESTTNLNSEQCAQIRLGFNQLRRAFLLNATQDKAERLAEIYRNENLIENASFYENLRF